MSIGIRKYSTEVVIDFTDSRMCELYDVVNLDDSASFEIKNRYLTQAVHPKEMEFDRRVLSIDNLIAQDD